MKKFIKVYDWKITDEVRNGNTVYVLDKCAALGDPVIVCNDLAVGDFFKLIDDIAKDSRDRYEVWKTVEVEEKITPQSPTATKRTVGDACPYKGEPIKAEEGAKDEKDNKSAC